MKRIILLLFVTLFFSCNKETSNPIWVLVSDKPKCVVSMIFFNGKMITLGNGVLSESTDNGATWITLPSPSLERLYVWGDCIYASSYGEGVFRSDDMGVTWTATNAVSEDANNSDKLIVGRNLYRLANNGCLYVLDENSWVCLYDDFKSNVAIEQSCLVDNGNMLTMAGVNGIFTSSDMGKSWTMIDSNLRRVEQLICSGPNLVACQIGGFYYSNGTLSFIGAKLGRFYSAPYYSGDCYMITDGGNIYALTGDGLFISRDNGVTWSSFNEGLNSIKEDYFITIHVSNGFLYLSSINGIWKRKL